jgi:hypothetical protein
MVCNWRWAARDEKTSSIFQNVTLTNERIDQAIGSLELFGYVYRDTYRVWRPKHSINQITDWPE